MSRPRKTVLPSPYPGDKIPTPEEMVETARVGAMLVTFDLAAATGRLLVYAKADGILALPEVEQIRKATRLLNEAVESAIADGGPNRMDFVKTKRKKA